MRLEDRRALGLVGAIVALITVAHIFLWRSDMPWGEKLLWTVLNGTAWTLILAPIFLVNRWLRAIKARNAEASGSDFPPKCK